MAGFVGDKRQWRTFEKRASKLFKNFNVDIFHTIDVRRTDKDFAGWKVDRKIEFLDEFQHIINETLESGVAAFLRDDDYKYYCGLPWPKTIRRDSKYALLVRACVAQIIDTIAKFDVFEPRLRFVLEDGHSNANDAVRMYDEVVRLTGQSKALGGINFQNKRGRLPLAAADLFAYTAWGAEVGQKPIGIIKGPAKTEASYRQNTFRFPLTRDVLNSLREQAIELANEN